MEFHRAASQPPVTGQAMRTGFRFRVRAKVQEARATRCCSGTSKCRTGGF
jgi:hypothetical protein